MSRITKIVESNQNIFDFALTHYGSPDAAIKVIEYNDSINGYNDIIVAGSEIIIETNDIIDQDLVSFLDLNNTKKVSLPSQAAAQFDKTEFVNSEFFV